MHLGRNRRWVPLPLLHTPHFSVFPHSLSPSSVPFIITLFLLKCYSPLSHYTTHSFLKNHTHNSRPKWAKSIRVVFRPKYHKNHTLWGRTYLYCLYKGVPPPPPWNICHSWPCTSSSPSESVYLLGINQFVNNIFKWAEYDKNSFYILDTLVQDWSPTWIMSPGKQGVVSWTLLFIASKHQ